MSGSNQPEIQYYHHGRFLVKGGVLPNAVTAFRTFGNSKAPCIIFPTCFGGKLDNQNYFIGEGKALDCTKYFIVTFALFSNGESSSPSNTPMPYNGPKFPAVSYEDNIRAQHAVLTKHLAVNKIHMVIGFSMGAQQAYHWAVMFPDIVEKYVVICGSARTSVHNQCVLEGPKSALTASGDFEDGNYRYPPQRGIRAFGRAFCAWEYGQADRAFVIQWFRENRHLYDGKYPDLNTFLREHWEVPFLTRWDANDLLTLLDTWQTGDVTGIHRDPDLQTALGRIKAKGLIVPCKTDLYFPPEDNETEMKFLGDRAKLVLIDSSWGHQAGGDASEHDIEFLNALIEHFLVD